MLRHRLLLACVAATCLACPDDRINPADVCSEEGALCADARVCHGNRCVPCVSQDECGTLACTAGRCLPCGSDDQCGAGMVCDDKACRRCQKSSECPAGLACIAAGCFPCDSAGDCGDGRACVQHVCQPCENESQCDTGQVCVAGSCVACTATDQCVNGRACVDGSCSDCTSSTQCLQQDACVGGRCGACAIDAQCQDGLVCVDGECAPCSATVKCKEGMVCRDGRCGACADNDECEPGQACLNKESAGAGRCGRCAQASQCEAGEGCVGGVCATCTQNSQCRPGEVCVATVCRACQSTAECDGGLVCRDGSCSPCASTDECPGGRVCLDTLRCSNCTLTTQCTQGRVCTASGLCESCADSGECLAGQVCRYSTQRCDNPGAPDHLDVLAGDAQAGTVSTELPLALRVRLVDPAGDPVPGVLLRFTVLSGGGAPASATATTARDGTASTRYTLGPSSGAQQVRVGRDGTPLPDTGATGRATVTFSFTASAAVGDHLELVAGDGQTDTVGATLPTAPKVRVVDQYGNAVAARALSFTVTAGGGGVSSTSAVSGADGTASTTWTLGTAAGANTLVVAGSGVALPDLAHPGHGYATLTFTATGRAAAPDHVVKVDGGTDGVVGTRLVPDPSVRLLDRYGNAIAGTALAFAAPSGGMLGSFSATTNAQGLATNTFTLGQQAGTQSVVVSRAGTPLPDLAHADRSKATATFVVSARAAAADHLEIVQGLGQSAVMGARLADDLRVRVVDDFGNPVAGVQVQFAPAQGDGTVSAASATSDGNGLATVAWTLGYRTGTQQLVATGPTLHGNPGPASVTFAATALTPAASGVATQYGDWLPAAGGTITISGTDLSDDATVTVGGIAAGPATISQANTRATALAPSLWDHASLSLGSQPVRITMGGTTLDAGSVLYVPRFTIKTDGTIDTVTSPASARDWLQQASAGTDGTASNWGDANLLTELFVGYDENNLYVGVLGKAQKHNAIVGYIYEDGLTSLTRPSATTDTTNLHDYLGDGNNSGDGAGCYFQNATCQDDTSYFASPRLSLDNNLSTAPGYAGFRVAVPGWRAHYAFGRTGNAIDLPLVSGPTPYRHNAAGVRNLASASDFGWSDSTVKHSESAAEWAIPWGTFAREPGRTITRIQLFVRLVGRDARRPEGDYFNKPIWAHQGLPADANSRSGSSTVTSVATVEIRGAIASP